jgi:hypothetical protein
MIFPGACAHRVLDEFQKIDQSLPIVAEAEPILNRRNSPLNSRAQISDGSEVLRGVQKKFALEIQRVTIT